MSEYILGIVCTKKLKYPSETISEHSNSSLPVSRSFPFSLSLSIKEGCIQYLFQWVELTFTWGDFAKELLDHGEEDILQFKVHIFAIPPSWPLTYCKELSKFNVKKCVSFLCSA